MISSRKGRGVLGFFVWVALSAVLVVATDRRPMTAEDLWAMARIASPKLSPDGKWVVYAQSVFDMEKNKGNSDLWLVPFDGSEPARQLTWQNGSDNGAVWHPDGRSLLFRSKRNGDGTQLYLLPMNGGEARPLTSLPVSPSAPQWSPDGKTVYFLAQTWPDINDDFDALKDRLKEIKDDPTQAKITESRLVRYWDHYMKAGAVQHLFALDVASGKVVDLMPGETLLLPFWSSSSTFAVSPDGTQIAFSANKTEPPYTTLDFDLFLIPSSGGTRADGTIRNLTESNPAFDHHPRFSPDGTHLYFDRNDRVSVAPDVSELARLKLADGSVETLLPDFEEEVGSLAFTPNGKGILFVAQKQGHNQVFRANLGNRKVTEVFSKHSSTGLSVSKQGDMVFLQEAIGFPARLLAMKAKDKEPRILVDPNAERMAALDVGAAESMTFKGADGDDTQMFVIYPPGFDSTKKWPLLQVIHGGPHSASRDAFHYRWNLSLFAAKGYVVSAVNFHGSTGFGQAFRESIWGAHGDKPFDDIMKSTDFLVGKGFIDEKRMAVTGGSYGGYMVSWIVGHTDRFAAAVNHAGVYDLMSQFASDWTWSRPGNYGAAPWEDPERIDRYSPSRFAKNFSTPTLIIHGEKDYRVPYTQGLNMYQVLKGKGVPSRLVIYPSENHWILTPKGGVLWWKEVHDWLGRYLAAQ
ncbi:S9 family peptidase [Sulfidibacter corallicola]|uniref:S9 family peptidase n=1 Tax=Sulfidibacter corallicola TaxID=2818388 RepID=A0A8A4TGQ3_SULCO|nr:S9 family peptidase [Sulfidibacter corallicola]QTD49249.1 S9 family peptidase [Sulfidibacter corallicola]